MAKAVVTVHSVLWRDSLVAISAVDNSLFTCHLFLAHSKLTHGFDILKAYYTGFYMFIFQVECVRIC